RHLSSSRYENGFACSCEPNTLVEFYRNDARACKVSRLCLDGTETVAKKGREIRQVYSLHRSPSGQSCPKRRAFHQGELRCDEVHVFLRRFSRLRSQPPRRETTKQAPSILRIRGRGPHPKGQPLLRAM